ncbi:MAG: amidohydrolase family protein [Gemmatimonadaceae bacterium]
MTQLIPGAWLVMPSLFAAITLTAGADYVRRPAKQQQKPAAVAFVNVNVLPMDRERVLTGQTVIVRDGRIAQMGPSSRVNVPRGVQRIDGRGKYLMPGLAEMHAHVLGPQAQQSEARNRDIMFLYVANGITTVRAMLGAPNQLTLRDKTTSGEILGPTIFVAAPSLNGQSAPDPATAARLVREHKRAGYDLLKLHPGLSRATYDSIVAVGREVGITWAGHVSQDVGIEHALATRQSTVDHLDGYIEGSVSSAMKRRIASPMDTVRLGEVWRAVEDDQIRALAQRTKEAGVWNVPTMFLWESFFSDESPEQMMRRDEMKYAPREWVTGWANQKRQRIQTDSAQGVTPEDAAHQLRARRKILKALADAGAPLLMGTDSPQMFNVPGFALHRELRLMREAGLTPYQILESGTKNVALYAERDLKRDGKFGTVTVGNRADLVLLDANPLDDLSNVAKRAGVMVRGRWVPRSEIDQGLSALAARFARS